MEIRQNRKTGDGFIKFSKKEIDIINKKGKLTFTTEQMGEFSQILMHTAVSIFKACEDLKEKNKKLK